MGRLEAMAILVMILTCDGFLFVDDDCDILPAPGCRCMLLTHPDITCSGLGLNSILDLNLGTEVMIGHLDLSSNGFSELPNFAFGGLRLKSLDLSETSQHLDIQPNAFMGRIRSSLESLSLKATQQNEIPLAIAKLRNLVKLDLSRNNIQSLRGKDFETFPELQTLYLEGNPVNVINRFLFGDNPRLTELSLSAQEPDSLEYVGGFCSYLEGQFSVLDVQYLTLSSLALGSLTCFHLLPNLHYFALVDNYVDDTKILSLPRGEDMEHVDTLLVEDNLLESFPSHLSDFPNLRVLSLRGNYIQSVQQVDLQGFHRLTHLNLAENRLGAQHVETYTILGSLQHLDLSNNELTILDASGYPDNFPDVAEMSIDISGNANISCGAQSRWLICLVGHQVTTGQGPFNLYDAYTLPCVLEGGATDTLSGVYNEHPDRYQDRC